MQLIHFVMYGVLYILSTAKLRGESEASLIQKAIKEHGARWVSGETSVSVLSDEEKSYLLGLTIPPEESLEFETGPEDMSVTTIDWRNLNGQNWLGPVQDQGRCGSCVAFAAIATLEAQLSISKNQSSLHPALSQQELFDCGGGLCNYGWYPDAAAQFLKKYGAVDSACLPYTSGSTGQNGTCNQRCQDWEARSTKINNYSTPTVGGGNFETIKAALANGPLVTTMRVYNDFFYYRSGIYKHVSGNFAGGHAISLVGYDDINRAWLIRNSWSKNWGDGGFAWISYDDVSGVASSTWQYQVDSEPQHPVLTLTSPLPRATLKGVATLSVAGKNFPDDFEANFLIYNKKGKVLKNLKCLSSKNVCQANFPTTQYKDGAYKVAAKNIAYQISTPSVLFYIQNSLPKLVLNVRQLGKKGRVKGVGHFVVKSNAGSVPLDSLEFIVYDSTGSEIQRKVTQAVVNSMRFHWNTQKLNPGHYYVQWIGHKKSTTSVTDIATEKLEIEVVH